MTLYEKILKAVNAADDNEKFDLYNDYAMDTNQEMVMRVDDIDFNELFSDANAAVSAVYYGDFNFGDEYATFNGYANLVSFPLMDSKHSPFYAEDVANWLYETGLYENYFSNLEDDE